jgi:uncharacterized protein (DUF1499 family)
MFSSNSSVTMPRTQTPCPESPNCVSSYSEDPRHKIEPIAFDGSPEQAMRRLKNIIKGLPRTRLVKEQGAYLHVEFRSRVFGFTDDVQFFIPQGKPVIHVRSASRVGYWDLGANRKRIEHIRQAFHRSS